jgi:hypothetical protein
VRVIHGDPRHSDHRHIIVEPSTKEKTQWRQPLEVMRKFETRWLEEEDCREQVEEAWEKVISDENVSLLEIQSKMLGELWDWDCNVLGALEKRIKKCTEGARALQEAGHFSRAY